MAKRRRQQNNFPKRETSGPSGGVLSYGSGIPGAYPYAQSNPSVISISDLSRKRTSEVRRLSRTIAGYAVTQRITNGVLEMDWTIRNPIGLEDDDAAIVVSDYLKQSLKRVNGDRSGSYRHFISQLVDDLLVINCATVERQYGETVERPFWLWAVDSSRIKENAEWTPQNDDLVYRYVDTRSSTGIYSESLFQIVYNVNTYELSPPSPMEVAYGLIKAWLGLADFQSATTSQSTQRWMMDIGTASQTELKAFREFWSTEVEGAKKFPIAAAGGQLKVLKIGANDDNGLYLKYTEYLMKLIGMAFGLSPRDLNITDHDNRATAGVAADSTFAYAIKPIAKTIFEALDQEVVKYFAPGFELSVTYSEPRQEADRSTESREDFVAGILTQDEVRALRGYRPIETEKEIA
jgi:hypothetical protein